MYDRIYELRRFFLSAAVAVVVVALGLGIYLNNVRTENLQAAGELGKIFPYYDRGSYHIAMNGIPEQNIFGLREIVAHYPRTDAGRLARFYLANAYYHTGEYDNAYEHFSQFKSNDPLLNASALAGRASIYEMHGDHQRAAELFDRAANRWGKTSLTPECLKHAGRNYMHAADYTNAQRVFEKLKHEHSESQYARDVDRYLAQISAVR